MRFLKIIFLLAVLLNSIPSNASNYLAIVGATVINTDGSDSIPNAIVLIKDSVIIAVGDRIKGRVPTDAEVIYARGKYIIPGLVDGHIHFFQSGGLYTRPDGFDLRHRAPYETEVKWIKENIDDVFRRYIRCGITTVIDMGGPFWNFDVREKSKNTIIAPRVFCSGPLIASYQPEALRTDDPPIIKVNNKREALELIRKQAKLGTDFIKVWYVVSKKTSIGLDEFYPIFKAIVKESHKLGLDVWVHATELETARKAVEGGADVLVHMVKDKDVDEAFLKLAKKKNIIIIPTLWVFNSYAAVYSKQLKLMKVEHLLGNPHVIDSYFDMYELSYDELGERQKKLQIEKEPIIPKPWLLNNLKRIQDYGITVAVGTDAGNVGVLHGPSIFHEFDYMRKAGLSNQEILTDATLNGANLIGMEKRIGSIEKGKLADIVVLNSNPLDDIQNTSDIHLVIKNGEIFEPEEVLKYSVEDYAQIQLNAYNNRNIEAFLAVYSPYVQVYEFPDKLLYTGRDKMREKYVPYFEKATELHCELVNRITNGRYVIDREKVTGNPRKEIINATAIYEIFDGYIQKVWFIKE